MEAIASIVVIILEGMAKLIVLLMLGLASIPLSVLMSEIVGGWVGKRRDRNKNEPRPEFYEDATYSVVNK